MDPDYDTAEIVSNPHKSDGREKLLATGSLLGALLVSSCCILPLVLISLGISGAWLGNLTVLEPYKPLLLAATGLILSAGFWHIYFRQRRDCIKESRCARPLPALLAQGALWLATLMALLSASVAYWAPLFY